MDALVAAGIELDHAYSYKFCSPTRSSVQVPPTAKQPNEKPPKPACCAPPKSASRARRASTHRVFLSARV